MFSFAAQSLQMRYDGLCQNFHAHLSDVVPQNLRQEMVRLDYRQCGANMSETGDCIGLHIGV